MNELITLDFWGEQLMTVGHQLTALEARRDKTRALKQGMMQ